MDVTDYPNSICQVERIEMYQLPPLDPKLNLPFNLLDGEAVSHHGTTRDGLILLTNYRLYLQIARNHYPVPLGLIELVEHKELFYLHIGCKDARTYRCTFENNESCLEWYDKILKAAEPPKQLNQLFAFYHFAHFKPTDNSGHVPKPYCFDLNTFSREMERLQFEKSLWRLSKVNVNYEVCSTYPPYLLVPKDIDDEELKKVAKFRSSRRIPAVVWRHTRNGAVIARCSQPEVGWFGWRGEEDEKLIQLISKNNDHTKQEKKVLILDARSYAIAVANRARGGGCECPEYYSNCEIQFMNLANIHSIRKSFHALRQLCVSSTDQTWHSQLENTKWLQHMSGLMKAAVTLVTAVDSEARPVVVHCSDGWDRTPQIVALGELLMDPFYRTVEGFRVLIEREWLAFGHKFADRCGHSTGSEDQNERCPVFLQWLDCVHQLLKQFPCDFEFSQAYLVKLAQHTYSNLFGTFLCNTLQERLKIVNNRTFSVWEFLHSAKFKNHLYEQPSSLKSPKIIWPQTNVRDLHLWREVYLGTMEANFRSESSQESCPGPPDLMTYHMTKTRSYNDLTAGVTDTALQGHFRRSSDPSINLEKKSSPVILETTHTPQHHAITDNGTVENNPTDTDEECNPDCLLFNKSNGNSLGTLTKTPKKNRLSSTCSDASVCCGSPPLFFENVIATTPASATKSDTSVFFPEATHHYEERTRVNQCPGSSGDDSARNSDGDNDDVACDGIVKCGNGLDIVNDCSVHKSIETSTETLVSENVISCSPREVNGFEKLHTPSEPIDIPDGSSRYVKISENGTNGNHYLDHLNLSSSERSNSPLFSRTSSSNGWDNTLSSLQRTNTCQYVHDQLGDDGLIPLRSYIQERISKIMDEKKKNEEKLQKEIHTYRQVLLNQVCLKCSGEKLDDNGSVVESVNSLGEGHASAVESLPSDKSWENLEYSLYSELQGTKWVPDHAVSRCTNCNIKFWIGKRKHHCRKCGNIFCADCSENSTPLPSEHLFDPVRVCTGCFNKLQRECGEILTQQQQNSMQQCNSQCKQANQQSSSANSSRQIAASSN